MKTIAQIKNKIKSFKSKLSKKEVYENFGDKEQMFFDDFIGSIWDYSSDDIIIIREVARSFFEWCINYTGREDQ